MEDKQIIIDETDISKCEFCYSGEYCHIYSGTADFKWMCKENEDCQIKNLLLQLKQAENQIVELNKMVEAKEQECEALASQLDFEVQKKECLEKECERLKEENKEIRKYQYEQDFLQQQLAQLKAENEQLQKEREKAKNYNLEYGQLLIKATNKNNKLSKTLTEIKEMLQVIKETNNIYPLQNNLKKILQKISECDVE